MNNNAKKWVEALKSGEFEQGKHCLASADGKYCCLGVACEVAMKEGVPLNKRLGEFNKMYYYYSDSSKSELNNGFLPKEVMHWLGLATSDGGYKDPYLNWATLTGKNDGGATFEEIAAFIESEPKGLFRE